jgi:hypothetical protein
MRNLTEVTRGEAVEILGSEDGRDQNPVSPSYGCLVSEAILYIPVSKSQLRLRVILDSRHLCLQATAGYRMSLVLP